MIETTALEKLSWNGRIPTTEEFAVHIPDDWIEHCPNIFLHDESIAPEVLQSESNQLFLKKVTQWTKKHLNKLERSPGFIIFKVKTHLADDQQLKSLYYFITKGFGELNNRYGELFEVKDRKLDYTKEAIPVSKTKASTGFHTDSTAMKYNPYIVGLLCLYPSKTGGISKLANASDLYQWMQKNHPDGVETLKEKIIRDVITPGQDTDKKAILKNRFPVFSLHQDSFQFRYMRYWIITGHERTHTRIAPELITALDNIDEYFNSAANVLDYRLDRGDILLMNNHFICHNRTAYEDSPEDNTQRIMIRTWINK